MNFKKFLKILGLFLLFVLFILILIPSVPIPETSGLRGDSIYQIMVDRFYDGDTSNNAIGESFRYTEHSEDDFRYMHGGDWQGIIDQISYIKDMGYTAIWISPVTDPQLWSISYDGLQFPTAYHGYNMYDPNRANRYFGSSDPEKSKQKLKELVDVCHKNEIKVILDVIPNHVGNYLQGMGSNAHYTSNIGLKSGSQVQPASPFNNISWYHNNGSIDFSRLTAENNKEILESYDLSDLDDLDYDNPEAKIAMFDSIKNWFSYTGADAARVDAVKCMRPSDVHDLETHLGVTTFGENYDWSVDFIKDWVGDDAQTGLLDYPLFYSIKSAFAHGESFYNLQATFSQDILYGSHAHDMVTFIDNHDLNRFLTEVKGDRDKLHNALTFIFTARGIPCVFQGTESNRGNANGELITNSLPDTWNRWSMVTKDANGNITHNYFHDKTDTYELITNLNALRSQYEALSNGTQREMWASTHTYAFSRRVDSGINEGQELICAFHNLNQVECITMPLRAESTIDPGTTLVNVMDPTDKITVTPERNVSITLAGNEAKIYTVDTNMKQKFNHWIQGKKTWIQSFLH